MAQLSRAERLKAKKAQLEALEAEIRNLAAIERAASDKERKRECFIIGAAVLAELVENPDTLRLLQPIFDRRVTKASERRAIAHMLPPEPESPDPVPGHLATLESGSAPQHAGPAG